MYRWKVLKVLKGLKHDITGTGTDGGVLLNLHLFNDASTPGDYYLVNLNTCKFLTSQQWLLQWSKILWKIRRWASTGVFFRGATIWGQEI